MFYVPTPTSLVRELPNPDEIIFRAVFHHNDDPERELTLAVVPA